MSGADSSIQDDVSITVGNQTLAGWMSVRITRSLEQMPSTFDLSATEVSPLQQGQFIAKPGDPVTISIGSDLVLTGYLDRYSPSISPTQHEVRLAGRSKCEDLVDSNFGPEIAGHQVIFSGSLSDLATRIVVPFGITVKAQSSKALPDLGGKQLPLMLSDTPWSVIERAARYSGVLVYDDTDGNLVIADVGTDRAGSDLVLGMNIQSADAEFSADQRFKDYYVVLNGMFPPQADDAQPYTQTEGMGHATDPAVTRTRTKTIVSSIGASPFANGQTFAQTEAAWQSARRAGRSFSVRIVTDSWRDGAGQLWRPNTQIGIDLPQLGVDSSMTWVIGTVTFLRDLSSGTTAELIIMPHDAFLPEPELDIPPAPPTGSGGGDNSEQAIGATPGNIPQGGSATAPTSSGPGTGAGGIPGAAGSPSGPPAQRTVAGI